ncbi:MAG TPA: plasmid stabilization protein [Lysobacter sp.]
MFTMTIRDIDEAMNARLRVQAALHGRSIEDEARDILRAALAVGAGPTADTPAMLVADIRALVEPFGGIELELPAREPMREPPDFNDGEAGG